MAEGGDPDTDFTVGPAADGSTDNTATPTPKKVGAYIIGGNASLNYVWTIAADGAVTGGVAP